MSRARPRSFRGERLAAIGVIASRLGATAGGLQAGKSRELPVFLPRDFSRAFYRSPYLHVPAALPVRPACTSSATGYPREMTGPLFTDALRVHPQDDVLVALRDLQPGETVRSASDIV